MRIATVIGRVTLAVRHPRYKGERLLLVSPWNRATLAGHNQFDPAIVAYDELGAGIGQKVGVSEGREAACPFAQPTPVDAYCAAIVDEIFQQPS